MRIKASSTTRRRQWLFLTILFKKFSWKGRKNPTKSGKICRIFSIEVEILQSGSLWPSAEKNLF
jgi:hypothetical protein